MEITSCGGCGSNLLRSVLSLRPTALADRFMETASEAKVLKKYPLDLLRCEACDLVQLGYHVPDAELYGGDYAFFTGSSPALKQHFADYAKFIKESLMNFAANGVVEIACNDGTLLEHFKHVPHLGIDPAGPATEAAIRKGLNVTTAPFSAELARTVVQIRGQAGLVIANNVLAHVKDPHDFIEGVSILIGDTGLFVGEVQYLPDLLAGNNFDLVYHEHRYFYSLRTLMDLFRRHGMTVAWVRHQSTQGGSIRFTARKGLGRSPLAGKRIMAGERSVHSGLLDLQSRVNYLIQAIDHSIGQLSGDQLVGYGASAKSCTLLHQLRSLPESIVDVTPYKIGKYAPGTGIVIVDSVLGDKLGQVNYLNLIGNYAGATLRREAASLARGNRFLFPLPYPMVV